MRAAADLVMFRRIIVVVVDDEGVVVVMVVVVVLVVVVVVVLMEVEGLLPESFILGSGSSSKITKDFPLFKFPCHINFILPCSKIQFE